MPQKALKRAHVSIAPRVGEAQALELGEGVAEVLGEPGEGRTLALMHRVEPAVVARVVAAPQDPAVVGHPVVVELIADVRDALPVVPAKGGALVCGEWLSYEHMVVHRQHPRPQPTQERVIGTGGEQCTARGDRPTAG